MEQPGTSDTDQCPLARPAAVQLLVDLLSGFGAEDRRFFLALLSPSLREHVSAYFPNTA
jgi:hypothetical protein